MSTFEKDFNPLAEEEVLQRHIKKALRTPAPSGNVLDIPYQVIKRLFSPITIGAEKIPDRPCLFIGNHSLFALDGWVLGPIMLKEQGRFLRGLGDRFLFANDKVGNAVMKMGGTMGHPAVCTALMEKGHDLLVFPGGAHEAVKRADDMYQLQWKERYGFVKLALKHGYTIMPFGMVGPDEFYSHLIEGEELPESALGGILKRLGVLDENTRPDMLPPIPIGALGSLFPKPKRCYLGFGKPVHLTAQTKKPTKTQLTKIRNQVASEIEQQLAQLLIMQQQGRNDEGLLRRILSI
ncbi:MAG: 1-acyl-sn-glycerol-3-phosphate acyltransferase [Halieaceae bacterium]|jgi:1-acyl-sn-glycerol-3-phosphate acyltransferase